MTDEYPMSFTLLQIKALIKALEGCGVDSGSPEAEMRHFPSVQLVTAAKSAYLLLQAKRERVERLK